MAYAGHQAGSSGGLQKPGKTQGRVSRDAQWAFARARWSEILSGIRLIKASEIAPIIDYLELNSVPVMWSGRRRRRRSSRNMNRCRRKASARSSCRFRSPRKPSPFRYPVICMLPKYENGDIIVVYREQRHPISSFYGEEAAVRLKTGERYLENHRARQIHDRGQPHEFQRQADQWRQAGMDRRNLRYPSKGPGSSALRAKAYDPQPQGRQAAQQMTAR